MTTWGLSLGLDYSRTPCVDPIEERQHFSLTLRDGAILQEKYTQKFLVGYDYDRFFSMLIMYKFGDLNPILDLFRVHVVSS